jgi:hypothetical protein
MKPSSTLVISLLCIQLFACQEHHGMNRANIPDTALTAAVAKMNITIGTTVFTATLSDNETAAAFKTKLPLTIQMIELNGNEKYVDLSGNLPARASNPGTIQAGDLMLYGSRTLVLFYKTFSTPYNYTRIGRIDDPSGLAAALGSGNTTVKFELE